MSEGQETIAGIISRVMNEIDAPIKRDALVTRLLQLYPSKAKNPRTAMNSQVRQQEGQSLVYLDADTILPIHIAMRDVAFRVILRSSDIAGGEMPLQMLLHYYLQIDRYRQKPNSMHFFDLSGTKLDFPVIEKMLEINYPPISSPFTDTRYMYNIGAWLKAHKAQANDYLVFRVKDWRKNEVYLSLEPAARVSPDEIRATNGVIADLFYDMLENAVDEQIYLHDAVPTIYARLGLVEVPGDHYSVILNNDPRIDYDGFSISYVDGSRSMFDVMTGNPSKKITIPVTNDMLQQVYRFRAENDVQRRRREVGGKKVHYLELQGKDTFSTFNEILREVFAFDDWYHMSGFRRLVKRGSGKRVREVKICTMSPDGEEDPDPFSNSPPKKKATKLAEIGLQEGDRILYIFDFGDWLEHILTLESISQPVKGIKYPRIID